MFFVQRAIVKTQKKTRRFMGDGLDSSLDHLVVVGFFTLK